jgi:hypothetical protein
MNSSDEIVIFSFVKALGEIGHKHAFLPLYEVVRGGYHNNITLAAYDAF